MPAFKGGAYFGSPPNSESYHQVDIEVCDDAHDGHETMDENVALNGSKEDDIHCY